MDEPPSDVARLNAGAIPTGCTLGKIGRYIYLYIAAALNDGVLRAGVARVALIPVQQMYAYITANEISLAWCEVMV